jgi:hypothetical protein
MNWRLIASLVIGAVAASDAFAADQPVDSAAAAIRKGRYVCQLDQPISTDGQWQAVLIRNASFGNEWHVWFGKRPEPACGFYGAIVKADGSYTSCAVTKCKLIPRKSN